MKHVIDWLMTGPAFVRHRCQLDLMERDLAHCDVKAAYRDMCADPLVQALVDEVNDWENQRIITRHNDAVHPLHKLAFAADIGIRRKDLRPAIQAVQNHVSRDGPFQIRIQIPHAFGGDNKPKWDWVATDAPLILYAMLRLGVRNKKIERGIGHIRARITDPGFPCFASTSMGRFKGPGRHGDPCPYANLIILRMLAEQEETRHSMEAGRAVEMLLRHWQERGKKKYYLFGIGTDFFKPKVPLIWYDVMHFVDTLTRFPFARKDERLTEVMALLDDKVDEDGRLKSMSIWTKWKGWEFCQKKEPSYWLTLLYHRARKRMGAK